VILTTSRIFDAVTDPTIGILSDRTQSKMGRRKPWVLAGGLISAVAVLFLFQPGPTAGVWYFGIASYIYYLGLSLFEIPRNAWTAEVTRDPKKRTSLNLLIAVMAIAGSLIFWLAPVALSPWTHTTQITSPTFIGIGVLFAIVLPMSVVLGVIFVPNGVEVVSAPLTFKAFAWSATRNRPLRLFAIAVLLWNTAQGATVSVIFIFVSDRLKLANAFAPMMMGFFAVQILTAPVWGWISGRIGRNRAWAIGLAADALTKPLYLLLAPGHALFGALMITVLGAFFGGPTLFAPQAMLSDTLDYDLMRSRVNKAGNMFSLYTLLAKVAMAFGGGAALMLLGLMHYQVGGTNTPFAEGGLTAAFIIGPGLVGLGAATVVYLFPLDARRHDVIRRRLEGRSSQVP
jgi:Na+/melibiose symporter-like transporter